MKEAQKKILIISHDKIGSSMAGPGIRYHYMAESLGLDFDTTVGFFDPTYLPDKAFQYSYKTLHIDAHSFEAGFEGFDVIIAHWLSEAMIAYCNQKNIFVVFDLYVPGPVENLAGRLFSGKKTGAENDFEYNRSLAMYRRFFENGDLFLVSNRRQLDFWIGYIFGADQIHLSSYSQRPVCDRFIYAPMGIDAKQPLKHTKNVIRGVIPGVSKADKILLWTGGIWGHFDGQVLIKAMKRLEASHPDVKLVFFGTQHPNPNIPEMKESVDTRKLSSELGLSGKTVFFNDGWVPYGERINYLLESDVAINTHKPSIEPEFSHRTRVLDHFLAGLPTIATEGDYLSDDVIKALSLGIVVPPDNDSALAEAILKILKSAEHQKIKQNINSVRKDFDWSETMRPLIDFLNENPTKLALLDFAAKVSPPSRPVKIAKKVLPVPVKKALIRILRMK